MSFCQMHWRLKHLNRTSDLVKEAALEMLGDQSQLKDNPRE